MGTGARKTLKERAFMLALDGAIVAVVRTIDAVRFVRKVRGKIRARRVKDVKNASRSTSHAASRKR